MPSLSLSLAMRSAACILSKVALSMVSFSICRSLESCRIELPLEGSGCGLKLAERQPGCDGEEIAACKLDDLASVTEAGAHDDGLVAETLVVVVDGGDRLDAGVVGTNVVLASVLLVPVEDASDEGRDQGDLGLGAGDGLVQTEEKGHVAVNAFLLELLGSLDALPGGGKLDEDAVAGDPGALVLRDDVACGLDGLLGVVGDAGIDLGGDAAGDDLKDLLAEGDGEGLESLRGDLLVGGIGACVFAGLLQYVVDDGLVLGHAGGCLDQGRVGGGIGRLVLFDRVDIAGVGYHGGGQWNEAVQELSPFVRSFAAYLILSRTRKGYAGSVRGWRILAYCLNIRASGHN